MLSSYAHLLKQAMRLGSGTFIPRLAGFLILICSMKGSTHAEGEVSLAKQTGTNFRKRKPCINSLATHMATNGFRVNWVC